MSTIFFESIRAPLPVSYPFDDVNDFLFDKIKLVSAIRYMCVAINDRRLLRFTCHLKIDAGKTDVNIIEAVGERDGRGTALEQSSCYAPK